jgi:hypothetical protein
VSSRIKFFLLAGLASVACIASVAHQLRLVRALQSHGLRRSIVRYGSIVPDTLSAMCMLASLILSCLELDQDEPSIAFSSCAAVATLLVGFRLLGYLCLWHANFAMFVTMLNLIVVSLIPFLLLIAVVLLSFAWASHLLASQDEVGDSLLFMYRMGLLSNQVEAGLDSPNLRWLSIGFTLLVSIVMPQPADRGGLRLL